MPSYSPVFSVPFVTYTPSTPNTSYLVPDGYTAVVRQVSGWQEIGGWIIYLNVQDSEAAPAMTVASQGADGVSNGVMFEGRWVCPGGGIISVAWTELGSHPNFYVGGYLLRNTLT